MKASTKWERRESVVDEFLQALERYLEAIEPASRLVTDHGYFESGEPAIEVDLEERAHRRRVVADKAGPAAAVGDLTGPFEMISGVRINPIYNWRDYISGRVPLSAPSDLVENTLSVRSICRSRAEEARMSERGIAGLVGRFVRFPADVREAAGLRSRVAQSAAVGVGIFIQAAGGLVVVGVVWAIARVTA